MEFFHKVKILTESTINYDVTFGVMLSILWWFLKNKILGQDSTYSKEIIVFTMTVCQKVLKSDFQSEFSMQTII